MCGTAVHACVKLGERATSFVIHICSRERPRVGAHPIVRLDAESWSVLPARYVRAFREGRETLTPLACPIADVLRNCPPNVSAEIDAL